MSDSIMSWRRFALCKDKFGLCTCWLTLFKFECSSLNDVKFASSFSWMTTDSQTEVLVLKILDIFHCCFSETGSWSQFLETRVMAKWFYPERRLVIFSHVKNAVRKADWMYHSFHIWKYSTYRILFARFIA